MFLLPVLLLGVLLYPGKGNGDQEDIFTRLGSDLLLPIRIHLTLNHPDRQRCDEFVWSYRKPLGSSKYIARHEKCKLSDNRYFPNTRISENGSLIISNVTLENDGIYDVEIYNSTRHNIRTDYYLVHVEGNSVQGEIFTRLGSDLLLPIRLHLTLNRTDTERCDWIIWAYKKPPRIWYVTDVHKNCNLSDARLFPNTRISENGSLIISNVILGNDGIYSVEIRNSAGQTIQEDYYIVHVEGNAVQEEIFTRPGSDLLIPIRHHLILNHTNTRRCPRITWFYEKPSGSWEVIARHWSCDLSVGRDFPDTRISVNGSLIISNVTLENNRKYRVDIYTSTGHHIQDDYYNVHVEVPVSVPVLRVSCPHNGSAEISCRVEAGTKPNISLSVIGGSKGKYSTSANNITAIVESLEPWNITCTARNSVSQSEESRAGVTCPVPVSDPVLDMRCLQNGSAEISCEVKNGTDPSIYLTVSGELEVYNFTSSERTARVTVPPVSPPDSWNIRCSAKNGISERSTNQTYDTCPVPVSIPVLHVSCLRNGSIRVTCRVEAGTKPNIHLSIIGESQGNYSTSANNITAIVKPPGPWNITCAVENGVSRSEESRAGVTCPVPVLHVMCLRNGSIRVTCRVEAGTKPNIYLSIIGESQGNYSTSANNITAVVKPPGPWNITCTVENGVSQSEESRAGVTCPEESRCGMLV